MPLEVTMRIRIHPSGGGSHDFFFAADRNLGQTILQSSPFLHFFMKTTIEFFHHTIVYQSTKGKEGIISLFGLSPTKCKVGNLPEE